MTQRILVTCASMLRMYDEFVPRFEKLGLTPGRLDVQQAPSEAELIEALPEYDGWILGDDPANRAVVSAGHAGKFRAAVRWGIGVENIDFDAFKDHGIPITNTPGVFGNEVADLALAYVLGLARQTSFIDREIRTKFNWPKPVGISTTGRTAAVVGYGSIGQSIVHRLKAFDIAAIVYDPAANVAGQSGVTSAQWPECLDKADFVIFACPLNDATRGMLNSDTISLLKPGAFVINVSRGGLIDEPALIEGLRSGKVGAAAFDVYATEPLPADSALREFDSCIFGSHNGSTTVDAVRRVSGIAIDKIADFLGDPETGVENPKKDNAEYQQET